MDITLKEIDKNNWEGAIDLPVSEDHRSFVASNLYSIAEAQFYPGVKCYGIYKGDTMIGFTLFGACNEDEEEGEGESILYPGTLFWIWRFMIAEGERFKGYGKKAMRLVSKNALENGFKEMFLSTEPENEKAINFYKSLCFKSTGTIQHGEEVFKCIL